MFLLAACNSKEQSSEKTVPQTDGAATTIVSLNAQQLKNVGIEIASPRIEHLSGTMLLQGAIDVPPQNTVSLSFPLGGYLKSTDMLPGTHVKRGQVLAVIEDMQIIQLQQDYLTAKTNLAFAETEFARQQSLNATKASSDKVFQQARAEMERQRILMNALAEKLQVIGINPLRLTAADISKSVAIHSPINGYVSKVNVTVGKYTTPTDVLFELLDPADIHLALNVFERDLERVSIGAKVVAYTNSEPERKFEAKVILINRTLDENRMAQIHCHFTKYNASLVPGMFMNGEIEVSDTKALTVPEEAVVRWENKYYVFKEEGKERFKMVEVTPGVLNHGRQQIEGKEIDVDAKLVVKNAFALLMKIKNTEETDE